MYCKIVGYILLSLFAFFVTASNYNEECQKQHGSEGGTITGKLTRSSGGCAFLCYSNHKVIKKPAIFLPENSQCGENKVCHKGYCTSPEYLKACQEKLNQTDIVTIEAGCTVVCTFGSETEEILKQEGEACTTPTVIGKCDHGLCEGRSIVTTAKPGPVTTPRPETTPIPDTTPTPVTTPKPDTTPTPVTTPRPHTTIKPATTTPTPPTPFPYEVNIESLCLAKYPNVGPLKAYQGKGTSGCQYYCYSNGRQLHRVVFHAPNYLPCGGKPGYLCSFGFCRYSSQYTTCQQRAHKLGSNQFRVEESKNPCNFICHFRVNGQSKREEWAVPDNSPCGVVYYDFQPFCTQGFCFSAGK